MEEKKSVYLDNAATTYPKPEQVYAAMDSFMREVGGSAGRSGHWRAVETGRMVYESREKLASLLGVGDPLRLVFTRNATEALNLAILGTLQQGDHVVTTSMEHNSVLRPLTAARRLGVRTTVVDCGADGMLDPARLGEVTTPLTRLFVVNHVSNVNGVIQPVADVAELARAKGVTLLVDAAQSAGRLEIDFASSGIDLLAFTGHKELFGPQGTGGLCIRESIEPLPLCFGGTGSRSSEFEQPEELPERYESGTLNAPGIVGLGAGTSFIAATGLAEVRSHELELLGRLLEGLARLAHVRVHGPERTEDRVGIVALTFDNMSPPDAAAALDQRYGIATRAGLHCAPSAHRTIGTLETGVLRVSTGYLNTPDDVDYLVECLGEIT